MAYLGIDVSKATFNCCLDVNTERIESAFDNKKAGFGKLRRWLRQNGATDVHACLESTGPYWRLLATSLHDARIQVSVLNPTRTVNFARSQMLRTKTDVVDARMLADFCATQKPATWKPDRPEILDLRGLLTYRQHLIAHGVTLKQAVDSISAGKALQDLHRIQIDANKAAIAQIDAMIKTHVERHASLREDVVRLMDIPGIGFLTGATLVAHLPVDRLRNAKAVAAYAGLTPGERQSGTSVRGKPQLCKTGNAELRRGLYMPALTAMRYDPTLREFAARLRAKGKANKQIIVAVMHKLVRLAYALIKTKSPYIPKTA